MAYIGREPQIGNFQICDAISTVNAQAAYTMQVSSVNVIPETANHMLVSLNGVIQQPIEGYTVAGAVITFSDNLVTGDVINFIQIFGSVLDLGVPSDDTVTGAKIVDNAINSEHYTDGSIDTAHIADVNVTTGKIANNAITLAKLAGGTDGNIISYDASGDPVAIATGSDGQVLTSTGAGSPPAFEAAAGGTVLQVKSFQTGDYISTTSTALGASAYDVSALGGTFTPTSSSSHIIVTGMLHVNHDSSYAGRGWITYNHSGISETVIASSKSGSVANTNSTFRVEMGTDNASVVLPAASINVHFTPATTNEITLKTRVSTSNSGYPTYFNGTENHKVNANDGGYPISSLTFWEISGGISPTTTNDLIAS